MDEYVDKNPRLGVNDKRFLFTSLIAKIDRLMFLNKFPVDQADFALSLRHESVEAAWRLLQKNHKTSVSTANKNFFNYEDHNFQIHLYPEDKTKLTGTFMNDSGSYNIQDNNRFKQVVEEWCRRQLRLEDQVLRADKVIKAIVHSCNTVGQYKRVSPELIGFLPQKYQLALKDYIKESPYPAITVEPEEIETTMATLAYASLQPEHQDETSFCTGSYWRHRRYNLSEFPRTRNFAKSEVRRLQM